MDEVPAEPTLGVVIVTFNAGSEAVDCLETLLAAARDAGLALRVAVVDNGSRDDTVARIVAWAAGDTPYVPPEGLPFAVPDLPKPIALQRCKPSLNGDCTADVLLIETGANLGFAGGVNIGLEALASQPELDHFWVLNPDTMVPPATAAALAKWLSAPPRYGLMGGRVVYLHAPDRIQIDGGLIDWRTGATGNLHLGRSDSATPWPAPDRMDFVMGGSMVASRAFLDRAGPMTEKYFLYYEEVDWAMQRGDLPFAVCEGFRVYHHAGSAIGSPSKSRYDALPLSLYFKHRGRMMFLRRFRRRAIPVGHIYTLGIAARLVWHRRLAEAWAAIAGGFGLAPPQGVARKLGPEVLDRLSKVASKRSNAPAA